MRLGKSWSGLPIRANGLGSSPWRSPRKRRLPRTVRRRGFVRPAFRFAGERSLSFVLGFRYYSCLQSKGKRLPCQVFREVFSAIFCDSFGAEKAEGILALHDDKGGMSLEPVNPGFVHANDALGKVKGLGLLKELSVFKNGVLFVVNHEDNLKENGAKVKPTGQLFSKKLFTKRWPIQSPKLHFSLDRIGRCPERIVRIRKSLGTNDLRRAGRFSLSP